MEKNPEAEILAGELAKLEVRPGDKLVIKFPGRLSDADRQHLEAVWKRAVAGTSIEGHVPIVLDDGATIDVLRAAE